jgi:membrane-bound lytic murein transglycosylase D
MQHFVLPGFILISLRHLPLNKLSLAIATTVFLSACSTINDGNGSLADDSASGGSDSVIGRVIANRGAAARVQIPSGETLPSDEIAFQDIWARLSHGFQFSTDLDNRQIQEQLAFYQKNSNLLRVSTERADPFMFEIAEALERRGMPAELALLPIVESAFNPNAAAPGNVVGMWQIQGATARGLGLKQDWWYDGRRDPLASTEAALDYLAALHETFNRDWLLALAAYNAGPGNIQKAIDRNVSRDRPTDFWSLNLPSVTKEYIPKLIALSQLVAARDHYGVELADIKNERVVEKVEIGYQMDLQFAASLAGLDPVELYQLNPGFRQWATHPDGPHSLLLPVERKETFLNALASAPERPQVTWDRYVVQRGDSLSKIARQFGTDVSALQQANGLNGSRIIAGESLLIPRAYTAGAALPIPNAPQYAGSNSLPVAPPDSSPQYTVRSGDTLWRIADRYNLSVNSLAQMNGINLDSILKPGQVLRVKTDTAVVQAGGSTEASVPQIYTVKAGDSLSRIARELGVGVAELAAWNGIGAGDLIHPGQALVLHPGLDKLN